MPVVNPGIRRFLGSAIQRLFNSASVSLPLTHTAIPARGSIVPSFTRATTETGQKWDEAGYLDFTALAGEIVFKGARRVRNLCSANTNDVSTWNTSGVIVGTTPNVVAAPDGTMTAGLLDFGANTSCGKYLVTAVTMPVGATAVISVYLRADAEGAIKFEDSSGVATPITANLTTSWQRFNLAATVVSGARNGAPFVRRTSTGQLQQVYVWGGQVEDVTGQADQAASEYVSVGVESAPAYHGSMIDGVKCFYTDRSGNPISTSGSYPLVGYVPWEARTNLLLQSAVVATQSITVAAVAHTLSFKGTGTITLSGVSAAGPLVGTGANDRVTLTFTPTAGSLTLTVSGSCTVGMVNLGAFAGPYIPTTTVAVARNADVDQYPTTAGPIAAAGSIALDFTPYHPPSGTIALWGTYVDASNYTAILHDATNLIFRKRIAGSNYDATIANAFVSGTTCKIAATWGAAGTAIYLDGVAGTPHANTTAAQIAATMQVGADGNSLQQPGAGTTNLRIWQRQLSSPEGVAVTA